MAQYRTAQGKIVDMASLAAKNEKTRAVGNMNVNARGDTLDSQNRIIKDNTNRVKKAYQQQVKETKTPVQQPKNVKQEQLSKEEQEFFDDDEDFKK